MTTHNQILQIFFKKKLTKCWRLSIFINHGTFKTNWNCYLIKAKRLLMKLKWILMENNRWILVEIKMSLVLKLVKNKI